MGVDYSTAARRLRALRKAGLLVQLPFPMASFSAIAPTQLGCELAADDLAPIAGVRAATARHDLMLADVARALEKSFSMRFETERRLRVRGFSICGHLPDGLLHRDGELPIAIEVELSAKAPRRLTTILDCYAASADVEEVWYVTVETSLRDYILRVANGRPGIHVKLWKPGGARAAGEQSGTSEARDA
jgi:hypothetical protein